MQYAAKGKNIPLEIFYLNCKLKRTADTEYRLMAQLASFFGKAVPPTGLPTEEVYRAFFKALGRQKQNHIIILDEIDQLVSKAGDNALYNLTRINDDTESCLQIAVDIVFANRDKQNIAIWLTLKNNTITAGDGN